MSRLCARCGHDGAEADLFCSHCGAPLIESDLGREGGTGSDTMHSSGAIPAYETGSNLPVGTAVLVVRRGPGEGSQFVLTGDRAVAGRSRESELFLDDVTVSRSHAIFERVGYGWTVRDSDSLNGTYVNRDRVSSHQLLHGDEVQIGKYRFVYLIGDGGEARA